MPFSYPTVTIGSLTYSVYCDLADANNYALASITADSWRDADTTLQSRALVSATRWLDEAQWLGDKADTSQELKWPRANISDVDSATLPNNLVFACAELATQLVTDSSLRTSLGTPLPRSLRAGSASIDYFRPTDVFIASFFPAQVMSYIKDWLQGGIAPSVMTTGTDAQSSLDDDLGFQHGL